MEHTKFVISTGHISNNSNIYAATVIPNFCIIL